MPKEVVVKLIFQKQRNGKEWRTVFIKNGQKVHSSEYTRQKLNAQ